MISIISPSQFKTIPWKNGLGETTELAISHNGTLNSFDWRLSIASVVNDGLFSDFSGYQRQLILIEGNGIDLQHDNGKTDQLDQHLKTANFDGGCKTVGKLISGSIKDFNVMTNQQTYDAIVKTYSEFKKLEIYQNHFSFIYSPTNEIHFINNNQSSILPCHHLLKIHPVSKNLNHQLLDKPLHTDSHSGKFQVEGKGMIIITLLKK